VNYQDWRDLASVFRAGAAKSRHFAPDLEREEDAVVFDAMADRCDEIAAGRGE